MITSALRKNSPDRALESLYRRHAADVYRYTLALLDRAADAEDATQTTFLNAYRALERGERPREAGPWLRTIALNVCREHYRRSDRRVEEVSLEEDPGDLVHEPDAPEITDVVRALSFLPFNQRAALVMREFEGRSLAEIARRLEVSSSAVEALLFRGRRALREQLDGALTCSEAERALSRQLDGALPRAERASLRAHLRACPECASVARRMRAQRSAIKSLALLPLPAGLSLGLGRLGLGLGRIGAGGGAAGVSAASATGAGGLSWLVLPAAKLATVAVAGAAVAGAALVGAGDIGHGAHHGASVTARPAGAPGAAPGQTAPGAASAAPGVRETRSGTPPRFAVRARAVEHARGVAAGAGGSRTSERGRRSTAGSTGSSAPSRPSGTSTSASGRATGTGNAGQGTAPGSATTPARGYRSHGAGSSPPASKRSSSTHRSASPGPVGATRSGVRARRTGWTGAAPHRGSAHVRGPATTVTHGGPALVTPKAKPAAR